MPSELESSTPDLQRASWARKTQCLEKTHDRDSERCVLLAHPLTSLVALTPALLPGTSVSLLPDVTLQALQLRECWKQLSILFLQAQAGRDTFQQVRPHVAQELDSAEAP